ncbi:MAG TPA: ATP-dependent zinc metalloprotease FtsH [Myxococcota bacterium]|nr:ATP-dependent zinc metalloprotease FtsH [Myxococcota bacterium]HRY93929.1 ATP-dependent zinc metalloprotease FtsH [Myxococcota bacterium]HSA23389.1 ATP-dependent zinc metalloprotease FtsH [Myxococcota bacterium]
MKQSTKTILLWVLLIAMFISFYQIFATGGQEGREVTFSEFWEEVSRDNVRTVVIKGMEVSGELVQGNQRKFVTRALLTDDLIRDLRQHKVGVKVDKPDDNPFWQSALLSWLPMIFLFVIFIFFMRQLQSSGGKAMSFGKSKARMLTSQTNKVTFDDVAGVEEAKEELQEIIEFLKNPKKFTRLGGRIPKGVLLMGPPGTGKTLLARAIAGEAGVPFFSISGSDFVEMFVGVGASRVRDLFEQGKKHAPCIIFIDELDAVGRHRGAGLGGGHDEREQTLNQLLVEMDGFESNEGVILVAATNRPDVLDPALLRPGRFDRRVVVPRPDLRGRLGILKVHTRKTPLGKAVDLELVARGTPGFSGADLENLVNEAALLAAREDKNEIAQRDLELAKDKVLMGSERKSMIISEHEKKVTAYHEAGHALVAKLLEHSDPLHKVSIIPRGLALGVTQQLPVEDRHTMSKKQAEAIIRVLLGGRVAEELVLQEQTSGAGNDIERATDLARKMVCEWGMSGKLGPLSFGKKEEQIFLGREIAQHRDYSEQTALEIDREVRELVETAHAEVRRLLEENLEKLHRIAQGLLTFETLDAGDVDRLVKGMEIDRPKPLETRLITTPPPAAGGGGQAPDKPLPTKPTPEPGVA